LEVVKRFDRGPMYQADIARALPTWVVREGIENMAITLLPLFDNGTLWVKAGLRGIVLFSHIDAKRAQDWHTSPPLPNTVIARAKDKSCLVVRFVKSLKVPGNIKSAVGAGDSMVGALSTGLVNSRHYDTPEGLKRIIKDVAKVVRRTLDSDHSVDPLLALVKD